MVDVFSDRRHLIRTLSQREISLPKDCPLAYGLCLYTGASLCIHLLPKLMNQEEAVEKLVLAHRLEEQAHSVLQVQSSLNSAYEYLRDGAVQRTDYTEQLLSAASALADLRTGFPSAQRIRRHATDLREEVQQACQHGDTAWDFQNLYDTAATQEEISAVQSFAERFDIKLEM